MKHFIGHMLCLLYFISPLTSIVLHHQGTLPNKVLIGDPPLNRTLAKNQNVIIYGIPPDQQQTQLDIERAVFRVFQLIQININTKDILVIKRLGQGISRSTAVLVHFYSSEVRYQVLKRRHSLEGTGFQIVVDVPKVISYRFRVLKPLMEKLRSQGRHATVLHGRLYVDGRILPDDLVGKYLPSTYSRWTFTGPTAKISVARGKFHYHRVCLTNVPYITFPKHRSRYYKVTSPS